MRTHSPTTDDSRYLRQIHCFPLLEAEEESSLARRWLENADGQAVHKILTSHLRLVPNVARSYRGYGLPLSDLISEGNVGLMQAAKRFDPEKGARFSTYAVWWIKATIQEYILRSWSLVKIGTTTSQRILFFKLRRMKNRIAAFQEGDMRPDQTKLIAERLGVDEQDVVEMNRRLDGDMSLNVPVGDDDQAYEWQDRLVDERPDPEKLVGENDEFEHRQRALREALTTLGDRERYVFEMRCGWRYWQRSSASLASECGKSKRGRSKRSAEPCDKEVRLGGKSPRKTGIKPPRGRRSRRSPRPIC
jgi:RNA polymerase sigma-32 factor